MDFTREQLLDAYHKMRMIRRFEEKLSELVTAGKLAGFLHLYAGQEAVAVGVCSQLRNADIVNSTHRGHGHCIAKGVAVALNPVPVADLFAAAMVDASMVVHLSRLYGMPLTRSEAGNLIGTIAKKMVALMGTVWAVHFVSSAIKFGTGGMSVMLTAGAQGAVAYYGTYIIGRAAERYFAQGKSWGPGGPKLVVEEILERVDRDSILAQARDDLKSRLKASA